MPVSSAIERTLQCVEPSAGFVCRVLLISSATRASSIVRGLPGRNSSYRPIDASLKEAPVPFAHGSVAQFHAISAVIYRGVRFRHSRFSWDVESFCIKLLDIAQALSATLCEVRHTRRSGD